MQTVQAPHPASQAFCLSASQILTTGRLAMAVSALGCVAATVIAYPYASHFSPGGQIAAHLALPYSRRVSNWGMLLRSPLTATSAT